MSIDEKAFGKLHRWWTRRRRARAARGELDLAAREPRLRHLLGLVAGQSLSLVFDAERGELDASVALPRACVALPTADDAWQAAVLRVALAGAAQRLRLTVPSGADPAAAAAAMRDALPALLAELERDWPGIAQALAAAERHARALPCKPKCKRPAGAPALLAMHGALPRPPRAGGPAPREAAPPASADALPRGTERALAKPRRSAEVIELPEQDDGANPLAHVFEKVRTAEEHTGGNRTADGSDELAAHLDALDDLDLRRLVRSRTPASSVLRADLDVAFEPPDLVVAEQAHGASFHYDEWDERTQRYLRDWCTVVEAPAPPAPDRARSAAAVRAIRGRRAREIRALRAEFAHLARAHRPQRRQRSGSEVDLDALVDRHGAVRAAQGGASALGDERLYVARRPGPRDVATLILLDASLSSDSWVLGRRVLDIEREAVVMLGEVLDDVRVPVAVAAFCSHARRDCRFMIVKDFADDWRTASDRVFGLRPDGYTRIGPALRHATELLCRTRARHRLLLVVSDCKPVDYDHYEGRRGVGDVRQALREARVRGVRSLALAVDARAGAHLPRMFGPRGFRVLPRPDALPAALARLHESVLA